MFSESPAFKGDLSSWDVSNVTNMEGMFRETKAFNGDMLRSASAFNRDTIKNWDLSGKETWNMFREDSE